jgi:hypothetical protein
MKYLPSVDGDELGDREDDLLLFDLDSVLEADNVFALRVCSGGLEAGDCEREEMGGVGEVGYRAEEREVEGAREAEEVGGFGLVEERGDGDLLGSGRWSSGFLLCAGAIGSEVEVGRAERAGGGGETSQTAWRARFDRCHSSIKEVSWSTPSTGCLRGAASTADRTLTAETGGEEGVAEGASNARRSR